MPRRNPRCEDTGGAAEPTSGSVLAPAKIAPVLVTPNPLIINLDVEPAPRRSFEGTSEEWAAFPACVEFFKSWRKEVVERTGRPLRLSWSLRLDDQIGLVYGRPD